jgi:TRAP-type C4-dicarboxylate transport system permease small subunit
LQLKGVHSFGGEKVAIKKFSHTISTYLDYGSRAVIAALMFLIVINVIMRAFGSPIRGTLEFVEFLNATVIGLALANCGAKGGHISVTFLYERLGKIARLINDVVVDLAVIGFLGLCSYRLYVYGSSMQALGQVSLTTQTPYYPFVFAIAIGFIVYCLVILGDLIENISKAVKE